LRWHPSHSEPEPAFFSRTPSSNGCNTNLNGTSDIRHWKASPRGENARWPAAAYVLTRRRSLRDEARIARVEGSGVPMTYRHFPGQFHGFFTMGKLLQQANVAVSEIAGWLKALK